MTEQELFNKYRKSNCKSFSDFLINKIAELETENERLTVSYETLKLHDEEEIGILKSENAELKGLVSQYKASKCSGISLANRNMIMSDQLTKAKELLKQFLEHYKAKTIYVENISSLLEEAENFLSEVEK